MPSLQTLNKYMESEAASTMPKARADAKAGRTRIKSALPGRLVMPIGKLDHYSIRTLDIDASRRFYTEVMGFEIGFRPAFDFPGVWLYNGAGQQGDYGVVHIIGIDPKNPE